MAPALTKSLNGYAAWETTFVRGNHDKAASGAMELKDFNPIAGLAALWTREQLTPENLKWLRALPEGPLQVGELPGVQFVQVLRSTKTST